MMAKRLAALLPFAALAVAILAAPLDLFAAAPVTRQVTLKAGQFAFDPPTLHVNRGDRVVITLQSSDVVHGLYVDGYGVSARVEPGRSERVEFVADKAGAFRYRCSVSCGNLHPFMIGELIVAPNDTFVRAAGLALVTALATLFYLRRFPPAEALRE
jgi:heme/copper-type cytochrome/quinol oxidase subunit 2